MKNIKIFLFMLLSAFLFSNVIMPNYAYADDSYTKQMADLKKSKQKSETIEALQKKWQGTCYSCKVVAKLIDAFMNGAGQLYNAAATAGVKLLIFGFIIWVPFWGLKHLASMGGANGPAMIMELSVMLFKIGCAYIVILSGIGTLCGYFLTPILDTGADYALAILDVNDPTGGTVELDPEEGEVITSSGDAVSSEVLNKILLLAKTASNKLATMMVIGSSLFYFGFEHPLNTVPIPITVAPGLLWIPDVLSIIVGVAIWCVGVFVSFSVCFYLLDVSFRLGFAVLLLPIAIGLWPFPLEEAKKKVGTCVAIAVSSAGLFVILATTSAFALVLLDNAFLAISADPSGSGGINKLFEALDASHYGIGNAASDVGGAVWNNLKKLNIGGAIVDGGKEIAEGAKRLSAASDAKEYVRNLFDLSEPYLFILLFCLVAAFKVIGETEKLTENIFPSELGTGSPMHGSAKAMTEKATQPARWAMKTAKNIALEQGGRKLSGAASSAGRGLKKAVSPSLAKKVQKQTKGVEKLQKKHTKQDQKLQDMISSGASPEKIEKQQKKIDKTNQKIGGRQERLNTNTALLRNQVQERSDILGQGYDASNLRGDDLINAGKKLNSVSSKVQLHMGPHLGNAIMHGQNMLISISQRDPSGTLKNAAKFTKAGIKGVFQTEKAVSNFKAQKIRKLDNFAASLQGNKKRLKDADGNRINITQEERQRAKDAAKQTLQIAKERGLIFGTPAYIRGKTQQLVSTIKHGKAKLGDALVFDEERRKSVEEKQAEANLNNYIKQEYENAKAISSDGMESFEEFRTAILNGKNKNERLKDLLQKLKQEREKYK